jgi:hypothetical protein
LLRGQAHHIGIDGAPRDFGDGKDIIAGGAQRTMLKSQLSSARNSIRSRQNRRLYPTVFFMRHGIGGIGQGRMNVIAGQAWIGLQQLGIAGAFAQLAKNQFHGNARSPDHRLPLHDVWIGFDAIQQAPAMRDEGRGMRDEG